MMVVLRLRNLDPVSIPHSACDELRFQTWPTPFEVYTCQTHDFLPSFEQPSYILVNSSILSPISPGKEFGPPFQSPLQPGIRHGTWSSSIRCIPMNLLFRSEQGEETSFFFFFFETWHFVGAEPCKSVWHLKVAAIPQWWQQWQQFPPVQGGVGVAIPVMVISSSGQFFSMVLTFILGSLAWSHFSIPPQNSLSYAVSL